MQPYLWQFFVFAFAGWVNDHAPKIYGKFLKCLLLILNLLALSLSATIVTKNSPFLSRADSCISWPELIHAPTPRSTGES